MALDPHTVFYLPFVSDLRMVAAQRTCERICAEFLIPEPLAERIQVAHGPLYRRYVCGRWKHRRRRSPYDLPCAVLQIAHHPTREEARQAFRRIDSIFSERRVPAAARRTLFAALLVLAYWTQSHVWRLFAVGRDNSLPH